MQQKYIAIGVVIVVALAAVGGGIAMVANSNNDDSYKMPDITGKWNLAYIEMANLCTNEGVPITKGEDVKIIERHVNPYEPPASLEIDKVGDHVVTGKFIYQKENAIHGTLNGAVVKFSIKNDDSGLLFLYEAAPKEGYMTCIMTIIKLPSETDDHSIICGVGYMMFIPEGGDPVPIRSDYFDMSILKIGTHIKSVAHSIKNFTEGEKKGIGREVKTNMEFSKAHSMISVFDIESGDSQQGVMAIVTTGVTPHGTVGGHIAGNALPPASTGNTNASFTGYMFIAHGKATFLPHLHIENVKTPVFLDIEYTVPYKKGGDLTPVYLSNEHEYKGTLIVKSKDKEPQEIEVTRKLTVRDNTFYSEFEKNGEKIMWFGEIYGHRIDIYLINNELKQFGRITGHIDNDLEIHLFGIMHSADGTKASFLEYTMNMVI